MKKLFIICLLVSISATKSYSQLKLVTYIGEKAIGKYLPRLVTTRSPQILTPSEVIVVTKEFKIDYGNGENLIYYSGRLYKSKHETLRDFLTDKTEFVKEKEKTSSEKLKELIRRADAQIIINNKINVTETSKKIMRLQAALSYLGYRIPIDGYLGKQTKSAIKNAFDFDCNGLSDIQILERIMVSNWNSKKPVEISLYELKIEKIAADQSLKEQTYLGKVDQQTLNMKLQDLNCGIGEICTNLSEIGGSVSFTCKSKVSGDNVSVTISTRSGIDLSIKSKDGTSAKISFDTQGIVSMSTSDGVYTRGIKVKD